MRLLRRHERLLIDDGITFEGRYTFANIFRATLIASRSNLVGYAWMAAVCAAIFLIVPLIDPAIPIAMLWFFYVIAFGFLTLLFAYSIFATAEKTYRHSKAETFAFRLSPNGLDVVQPKASSHIDWSFFKGYRSSGDLTLLVMPDKRVVIIPRSAVAPGDLIAMDELIDGTLSRLS